MELWKNFIIFGKHYVLTMIKRLLLSLSVLTAVAAAAATDAYVDRQLDSLKLSHNIIRFGSVQPMNDTIDSSVAERRLIDHFYYDQFRHFQDPAAPYFLFMSRDASLAMGVGGCVRLRGWYDWGGAIPANGFSPYLIDMQPDPTRSRSLGTTPAGTCLFYRVIGFNHRWGTYQLYIEANFNGYSNRDFHLKKAYATINDWTMGYASSTFSDPAAEAPTVDASGPNNKIGATNLLVRWMHTFRNRWTVAASLETPSSAIADVENVKKVSDWLPDVAAFGQLAWGRSEHVRLAGILRTLSYRDLLTAKNHNKLGWGLQLSSVWHPAAQWTTYAIVNGGMGYEGLGGDLQIGSYDLVADPDRPGEMYAPAAVGFNIGMQFNFTTSMFVSANYGQSRYLPRHDAPADEYRYGQYMAINYFWNITPRIQAGAEFDMGMRKNVGGQHKWARRAGLMAQFSF